MRIAHSNQPTPVSQALDKHTVLDKHPPLYELLIVDIVDNQFLHYPQCPQSASVNMGEKAWPQSVDTVDSLDARFKSLYPFCLKNRQLFWLV